MLQDNPQPEQGGWDLDTYSRRIIDAIESAREIAGSEDINVIGFCAGGILSTTALNPLAAESRPLVHSMSYSVTLLDFGVPAPIGAFSSSAVLDRGRIRFRGAPAALCARYAEPRLEGAFMRCIRDDEPAVRA